MTFDEYILAKREIKKCVRDGRKSNFAGGCFWCMVQPFDTQPGIISVVSGYTGGHVPNPTYEQVLTHTTGHTEAVEITFDPAIISTNN